MFYILVDTATQSECMTFTNFSNARLAYNQKRRESDGTRAWELIPCGQLPDNSRQNSVKDA